MTNEMENPAYRANNADRCYHCKDELFSVLDGIAERSKSRLPPMGSMQTTHLIFDLGNEPQRNTRY